MLDLVQALVNGLFLGTVFSLAAVGLTVVFGVTDMINFAHGELIMVAMYVGFFMWSLFGLDPLVSIPIAAVVVATVGWLAYRGIIKPVLGSTSLAQMIVTFGLMTFLRGVAQFAWTSNPRTVAKALVGPLRFVVGGVVVTGAQLVSALAALACTAALAWFVYRTDTGRALQAVGEDPEGAALMGINTDRMFALAWTLAGAAAGVAGALLINSYEVDPFAGVTFGLMSIVTVALGGFGSVIGAAVAGVCIGIVQGAVGLYLPSYPLAAALAVYVLVLVVRPSGLRGTR
jgi:branched-chain amino acid transport system permease protein